MPAKKYICLNGEMFPDDSPVLLSSNRAFRYGDALFETMHAARTKVQFIQEHTERLRNGMKTLKMNIPVNYNAKFFQLETERLLNKNKLFLGARIRLTVFRNDGGLYTPETNGVSYLIEAAGLDNEGYALNKKGQDAIV